MIHYYPGKAKTAFLLLIFMLSFSMAKTQSLYSYSRSATTSSTTVTNGSVWANLNQALTNDSSYATSYITGNTNNATTNIMDAKGWGFQSTDSTQTNYIPADARINGIKLFVRMRKTLTGRLQDSKIMLLKAGSEAGVNKARARTNWPSAPTYIAYGSATDLWGTTWTASDLTNPNFGARIAAVRKARKDVQAEIDEIIMLVYINRTLYYSKATGNLENTATWGTNPDGSGTAPANFSTSGQVFILRNRTSATLTADLNISGTYSGFVVGNDTAATTLTIPANYTLTSSTVDVKTNSSLIISNTTAPDLGDISPNTTITYNAAGDQTIGDAAYYNLTLGGSGKKSFQANASATTSISNILNIAPGVTADNKGNNIIVTGSSNGISNNGTATGSGRYTYSLDANSSITGTGTFSNLEIDNVTSTSSANTVTLNNLATVTDTLVLTNGTFGNGNNLVMGSGSTLSISEGTLGSTISGNVYNITYVLTASRTASAELPATVKNLTLQTTGNYVLTLNKNLALTGNLVLNSGTLNTINGNNNYGITFNGSSAQTISSSVAQNFYNLTVNNAAGGSVTLSTPVTVSNALSLTNGIVTTSSANSLTLGASASVTGGSANSYINGPLIQTVASTAATSKVFPIGKANAYRPVTLTVTHTNTTATTYTAEMISGVAPYRNRPFNLTHISSVRYYSIHSGNNSANLSSATVRLTYGADDKVTSPSHLHVIKSYGTSTSWMDIKGTVDSINGTITSRAFTSFSDFVLADSIPYTTSEIQDVGLQVTPLKWISFTAAKKSNGVELNWETVNEANTENFVVERSKNGSTWTAIGTVTSNNNDRNSYSFSDYTSLSGSFYRIRQNDKDGKFTYSLTVQVSAGAMVASGMNISPNPVTGSAFNLKVSDEAVLSGKEVIIKIMDLTGAIIHLYKSAPASVMSVQRGQLQPGMYVVHVQNSNKTIISKIVVQ